MSLDKPVFTISVAANLLGLHPRTLMLYEKNGFLKPHRTSTNRRLYSQNDLKDLQFVKYLTTSIGLNIEGVKLVLRSIEKLEDKGIDYQKTLFPDFKAKRLLG